MRKLVFLSIFLIAIVSSANAQNTAAKPKAKKLDVPEVVKTKVKTLYPNTKEVEWMEEGDNYEAEIELKNGSELSLVLNPTGDVLETETEIKVSELPESVLTYVREHLNNAKIREACKIVKADQTVEYEAQVGKKDYMFDSNGAFLKIAK